MIDEIKDKPEDSDSSESSILAKASDVAFDFITGTTIPAPVRRNFFKAVGQLCTAAVDVPVAYLEGKAGEIRARNQGREKTIITIGDKIAEQVNVPVEYADAAVMKEGSRIIRKQINLDKVFQVTAEQVKQDLSSDKETEALPQPTPDEQSTEENTISDDWLNTFEEEASSKSSEEMQLLFGRILAGEIQKPKSFSIKTLKLIGELDSTVAALFQRFCSLSVSIKIPNYHILDARVVSLGGNAAQNSLREFGLGFDKLNILQEYGLIISDYNSYFDYKLSIVNKGNRVLLPLIYQNTKMALLTTVERSEEAPLNLHGVALSGAGKELLGIVDVEHDEKYTSALVKYFANTNLELRRLE
ncbi:MAG TPA: DUF2806 domain-containing protein [Segetibacter sp.]|jgi:hypothetical protein